MKIKIGFIFLLSLVSIIVSSQTVGPKNGKLMIVGGGSANSIVEFADTGKIFSNWRFDFGLEE